MMTSKQYLLAEMRCAAMRAGLARQDIIAIGVALRDGLITEGQALCMMQDYSCMHWIEPTPPDDYQPRDDFAKSIEECYRAIRERVANGGPPWEPKPPAQKG